MFRPSSGLLLRDDLHHAFDRFNLSLYHRVSLSTGETLENSGWKATINEFMVRSNVLQDGSLYVHFFSLTSPGASELHGRAIPPHWFRGAETERPDPVLLQWHWSQCVKARLRGFSSDMQ